VGFGIRIWIDSLETGVGWVTPRPEVSGKRDEWKM